MFLEFMNASGKHPNFPDVYFRIYSRISILYACE